MRAPKFANLVQFEFGIFVENCLAFKILIPETVQGLLGLFEECPVESDEKKWSNSGTSPSSPFRLKLCNSVTEPFSAMTKNSFEPKTKDLLGKDFLPWTHPGKALLCFFYCQPSAPPCLNRFTREKGRVAILSNSSRFEPDPSV